MDSGVTEEEERIQGAIGNGCSAIGHCHDAAEEEVGAQSMRLITTWVEGCPKWCPPRMMILNGGYSHGTLSQIFNGRGLICLRKD
ncbi:hypothetical protein VNO78_23235 [Psophocarpus tetragonolobus]|uniref:Uncharacterized protein n=1 Tax=Psophocarpus tetragonolobus TaxID=3891 RepID=A0AAN9S6A4_PSOTE